MATIAWQQATDQLSYDLYVKRYTLAAAFMTNGDETTWLPLPHSCSIRWSIQCNADYGTTDDAGVVTPNLFILGSNQDVLTVSSSGLVMANPAFASRSVQPMTSGGFVYNFTGEILVPHSFFGINIRGTPATSFVIPTITIQQKVSG